jgi:hypothetical protein
VSAHLENGAVRVPRPADRTHDIEDEALPRSPYFTNSALFLTISLLLSSKEKTAR